MRYKNGDQEIIDQHKLIHWAEMLPRSVLKNEAFGWHLKQSTL